MSISSIAQRVYIVRGPFTWRIPGNEGEPGAPSSAASGRSATGGAATIPTAAATTTASATAAATPAVAERATGGGRPETERDKL